MTASMLMPHRRYVYERTSDGEGGFTKVLKFYGILYGPLETYNNEPIMVLNKKSNVKPEDILGIMEGDTEAQYEVKSVVQIGAAQHKRAMLSRRDRPIRPTE